MNESEKTLLAAACIVGAMAIVYQSLYGVMLAVFIGMIVLITGIED